MKLASRKSGKSRLSSQFDLDFHLSENSLQTQSQIRQASQPSQPSLGRELNFSQIRRSLIQDNLHKLSSFSNKAQCETQLRLTGEFLPAKRTSKPHTIEQPSPTALRSVFSPVSTQYNFSKFRTATSPNSAPQNKLWHSQVKKIEPKLPSAHSRSRAERSQSVLPQEEGLAKPSREQAGSRRKPQ